MTPKEIRSRRLALGMSVDARARELSVLAIELRAIEAGERTLRETFLYERTFLRLEATRRNNES